MNVIQRIRKLVADLKDLSVARSSMGYVPADVILRAAGCLEPKPLAKQEPITIVAEDQTQLLEKSNPDPEG